MSAITLEVVQRAIALSAADGFDVDAAKRHMSVQPRPIAPPPGVRARQSAVLLLLYPAEGDALHSGGGLMFPLMRRAPSPGVHGGQISLPGGSQEAGETIIETALREAEEEMGIPRAAVRVLGTLASIYVPPSNFEIHPVVGVVPRAPQWVTQPTEVAELIPVPAAVLLDDTIKGQRTIVRPEATFEVRVYAIGPHEVWGATAAILGEFESRVRAALR